MSKRHKLILTILIHLLTFIAGFLNGVFFIIAGTAVSHHTGTITRVALTLSQGAVAEAAAFLLLILSFYIGACISGMLFHKSGFLNSVFRDRRSKTTIANRAYHNLRNTWYTKRYVHSL